MSVHFRLKHAKMDVCSLSHTFSFVRRFISALRRQPSTLRWCLLWKERTNLPRPTKPSATTRPSPEKPLYRNLSLWVANSCSLQKINGLQDRWILARSSPYGVPTGRCESSRPAKTVLFAAWLSLIARGLSRPFGVAGQRNRRRSVPPTHRKIGAGCL
jgi:hypothetical protein